MARTSFMGKQGGVVWRCSPPPCFLPETAAKGPFPINEMIVLFLQIAKWRHFTFFPFRLFSKEANFVVSPSIKTPSAQALFKEE